MTDLGHFGTSRGGVCVDIWGAGPFVITAGGKQFRFEDSDRFGPALVGKSGALLANPYPPERSPFWGAHRAWVAQGRRLNGNICMFNIPKPTLYRKDAKGRAVVVEHGDEGGGYFEAENT